MGEDAYGPDKPLIKDVLNFDMESEDMRLVTLEMLLVDYKRNLRRNPHHPMPDWKFDTRRRTDEEIDEDTRQMLLETYGKAERKYHITLRIVITLINTVPPLDHEDFKWEYDPCSDEWCRDEDRSGYDVYPAEMWEKFGPGAASRS